MGVSGSGKTTVGRTLAARLGWRFADSDAFHPAANVAKMTRGVPLTDEDRWPWLDAIAAWIASTRESGECGVVACSALKRAYRDRIAAGRDDVRFVYLRGGYDTIAARMHARTGHYMPPSLLQSQFDALEEPAPGEAVVAGIDLPPDAIVAKVIETLGLAPR
jgi:gluconokinase